MTDLSTIRHLDREARGSDLRAQCHQRLRDELIKALMEDPQRVVATPGFHVKSMTAADVVRDDLCSKLGDKLMHELLWIAGEVAKGQMNHKLHLRAAALIAGVAKSHADYHADDEAELCDEVAA